MERDQYDSSFWPVDSWSNRYWPIGYWSLAGPLVPPEPVPTEIESDVLDHPPSQILLECLLDHVLDSDWTGFYSSMPDAPDNAVAVFDTTPIVERRVRNMNYVRHYGLSVIVRSVKYDDGFRLVQEMVDFFSQMINQSVTLEETQYEIRSVTFATGIIALGVERRSSKGRFLFSMNLLSILKSIRVVYE